MRVRYVAPFSVMSGYARAAHDYLMALRQTGVELDIVPIHDADSENLEPRYGCLLDLVSRNLDPTHVVVHTIPRFASEFVKADLVPRPGVHKICVTTWETDKFPKEDAKNLNAAFDAIVVPSHFSACALLDAGVDHHKVVIIPHGFDPRFWWSNDPVKAPKREPYIFYSILVWSARKAPIELLKAYLTEFRAEENVLLRIVAPYVNEEDVATLVRCLGFGPEDYPKVEFITKRLSEVELRELHLQSHCFVSLSRGEAWGLGAFEATLVGNPVIVTGFSGWRDYLNDYPNAEFVGYQLTPAVTPEMKTGKPVEIGGMMVTPLSPNVPTGISGDQNWAEPDIHNAKRLMRATYKARKGKRPDRLRLGNLYSYEAVGRQWRHLLEAL